MGSSRRRRQGEFRDQEGYRVRSDSYRRSSQETWPVPSWEKKFCFRVGSVPWRKLLETKKYMCLYDGVVKWNDSAGEEAFNNAKSRYWAKINGLPCDISLPDPDIYIDNIDWDASIDPEPFLDLERESIPSESDESNQGERVVILGHALLMDQSFSCIGWGDTEEAFQKVTEAQNAGGSDNWKIPWEQRCDWRNKDIRGDHQGWGYNSNGWGNGFNRWGSNCDNSGRAYGDHWATWGANSCNKDGLGWNNSRYKASRFRRWGSNCDNSGRAYGDHWATWGANSCNKDGLDWNNSRYKPSRFRRWGSNCDNSGRAYGDHWATWGANSCNKDGSGWNNSRYKASRFHCENYQTTDHGWRHRSGRRKRANVAYEKHASRLHAS
ncbi:hypothetical protein L484_015497 [Morus notabilis]|uniref:Uncharacterized protein n=1 Tax=Morus notabilis TaxID=981085 RepID=W9S835_9ROSA|nr:uncharacterized protein LOC21398591 [Morus notabilis]EXB93952.1 hypothetical protein L484_015497 [Morus notabilis]